MSCSIGVKSLCPYSCGCSPTLVRIPNGYGSSYPGIHNTYHSSLGSDLGISGNLLSSPTFLFMNSFTFKDNANPPPSQIKQHTASFIRDIQSSIHDYLIANAKWYEFMARIVFTGVGMKADVLTTIFTELKRIVDSKTGEVAKIKDIENAPVITDSYGKPVGLSYAKLFEIFLHTMFSKHQLVLHDLCTLTFARWPKSHFRALYPGKIELTNAEGALFKSNGINGSYSVVSNPSQPEFIM